MERYRKILAAVDGSDSSKNAFRQACKIARSDKSWLAAITAIPLYADQFDVLSMKEKVSKALRDEGERILSEIKKIAEEEDVVAKPVLKEGSALNMIIDTAEEGNYDLIVMGRRGITHVERALVGSVAASVIGHSKRDILIVPRNTSLGWKNILLATDGSKYSKIAAEKAIELAGSYHSRLKAVSIVDVTDEFQSEAPDAVEALIKKARQLVDDVKKKANGLNVETLVKEGEAYEVITNVAKESRSDVIVMGSHGRTGVKRLLMGNVAGKVIGYAPCPVLVVKG